MKRRRLRDETRSYSISEETTTMTLSFLPFTSSYQLLKKAIQRPTLNSTTTSTLNSLILTPTRSPPFPPLSSLAPSMNPLSGSNRVPLSPRRTSSFLPPSSSSTSTPISSYTPSFPLPSYLRHSSYSFLFSTTPSSSLPNSIPLPTSWDPLDKCALLELSSNSLECSFRGSAKYGDRDAAAVRANHSVPTETGVWYFEVEVLNKGVSGYIGKCFLLSYLSYYLVGRPVLIYSFLIVSSSYPLPNSQTPLRCRSRRYWTLTPFRLTLSSTRMGIPLLRLPCRRWSGVLFPRYGRTIRTNVYDGRYRWMWD